MKLTLGLSPCPNDTFIFDALINRKIDRGDLEFEPVLADVETLNEWALSGKLDITKLSFPAYFQSKNQYRLLHAGSALGMGVGPLLISKTQEPLSEEAIRNYTIMLPGTNTTAHLLFNFAFPGAMKKKFGRFDTIEDTVLSSKEETLGVIIHENRFTYRQKGLYRQCDLGEFWEKKIQLPIPLGGIAVRNSLDMSRKQEINTLVRNSLEHAFSNYPLLPGFVLEHAQALSEEVIRNHINLYVNSYSLELGETGREAIGQLYRLFRELNPAPGGTDDLNFL